MVLPHLQMTCLSSDDSFLGNGSKVRDLIESADIHHLCRIEQTREHCYWSKASIRVYEGDS